MSPAATMDRPADQPATPSKGRASGKAFPRSARLTKPFEFQHVFRSPRVSADRCFKVLARSGPGAQSRLGMAVSKQVDRRAPGRNRIKRVIRESFRQTVLPQAIALDIVVLPRRECDSISNDDLFNSLNKHWQKLLERA